MDKIDFEKYADNIPKLEIREGEISIQDIDTDDVWKIVTENLRMVLDRVEYDSWFAGTYLEKVQNGVATISCSNEFKREAILRDYNKFLQSCLTKATGQNLQIEMIVKASEAKEPRERYKFVTNTGNPIMDLFTKMEGDKKKYEDAVKRARLNPRYTFKNFVIGSNNRLAEAVAQSVVSDLDNDSIAKSYNPVFYYGSTGVGKTHLMQAIGNEVLRKNPDRNIAYVSIEQFLNEMIEAIRTRKNEDFRSKYREVDLLIIDDIQFVEAYPKTQEELFHTFNTLYQANKQIILASDRPPRDIKNITDRLRTRFEGGMVCDIQAPEYETRLAILKQIMLEKGVTVPDLFLE
jgi:chromosomal replication initiator protein